MKKPKAKAKPQSHQTLVAYTKVLDALKSLSPDSQRRVLSAVEVLLDMRHARVKK